MKIYLSGPMSGKPDLNRQAFAAAAQKLRDGGHIVFNPAETEDGWSYREYLAYDVAWIFAEAEAIALLSGWEDSKGAMAEKALADALNLEVIHVTP